MLSRGFRLKPAARSIDQALYVEFLGVPRERAGVAELEVEARTLGQLLVTLWHQLPALSELIVGDRCTRRSPPT